MTPTPFEVTMQPDVAQRLAETFESLGLHPLTAADLAESLCESRRAAMDLRCITAEIILDPDPAP